MREAVMDAICHKMVNWKPVNPNYPPSVASATNSTNNCC